MKRVLLFGLVILFVSILGACGGNTEDVASSENNKSTQLISLEASNWDFNSDEYTAAAGDITIELKNVEGYHGIMIDGTDVKIDGDGKATVNLEAGEYIIRCSIPCGGGHAEMTAKLVVS
ncbi:cytochrome c oxidase subunit II [Litchfieldia alkalitelluris]|uniref:cytochrome C oxidase subunit II n=1 Tax=Litchfieldia alkalitelluris TaxID=304268 RepID=UPI00099649AA|nr:cytochrome C oxidase subunit II [Litchfieldia alkalitelluris]